MDNKMHRQGSGILREALLFGNYLHLRKHVTKQSSSFPSTFMPPVTLPWRSFYGVCRTPSALPAMRNLE